MFQIGFCCYFGQAVSSTYDQLSLELYESNWIRIIQDPNSRRGILFLMEHLKKDCIIFIGKIMPMLLYTFSSVCSIGSVQ